MTVYTDKIQKLIKTYIDDNHILSYLPEGSLNVAIYYRVEARSNDTDLDPSAQIYDSFVSTHPLWKHIGTYRDVGGTDYELYRMLQDCFSHRIDLVITPNVGHFTTDLERTVGLFTILEQRNIGIYFMEEHLYTLDSRNTVFLVFLSILAEEEISIKRRRSASIKSPFHI